MTGRSPLQVTVLAFERIYLVSGVLLLAALPLLFLFRTGKPTRNSETGRAPTSHAD